MRVLVSNKAEHKKNFYGAIKVTNSKIRIKIERMLAFILRM